LLQINRHSLGDATGIAIRRLHYIVTNKK